MQIEFSCHNSDLAFRRLVRRHGVHLTYTQAFSIRSLPQINQLIVSFLYSLQMLCAKTFVRLSGRRAGGASANTTRVGSTARRTFLIRKRDAQQTIVFEKSS